MVDLSVEQAAAGTTSKEPGEVEDFNGVEVLADEVDVLIIASSDEESCEQIN